MKHFLRKHLSGVIEDHLKIIKATPQELVEFEQAIFQVAEEEVERRIRELYKFDEQEMQKLLKIFN